MKKLVNIFKSLSERQFWRVMLPLAIPIALQNLLTNSFQLVDTLMVGKLGDSAIAAVGSAGRISFFAGIVIFGFASGGAVFLAQYWGANDTAGLKRAYGFVLVCTTVFASILAVVCCVIPRQVMSILTDNPQMIADGAEYLRIACFSYVGIAMSQTMSTALRCTERVKLPMFVSFAAVGMNALLNYILIFGKLGFPAMGIRGAACATLISALLNPVLLLLFSIKSDNIIVSRLRDVFNFPKAFVKEFVRRAAPVLFNETLWVIGMTVYDAVYGRMGAGNYTALTVFRTVESIVFVSFVGVCNACNVIVGKSVGEGNYERAKLDARRYTLLVPILGLLTGGALILLRKPILSLFDITDASSHIAEMLMIIYGLEVGLRNIPYMTIVGIFRAGGDTKTGLIIEALDYYLLAIPLTIVLGLVLKLDFLLVYLIMLLAEDLPKSIFCLVRLLSDKWILPVDLGRDKIEGKR